MDLSGRGYQWKPLMENLGEAFCKLWVILSAVIFSSKASDLDALVQD